MIEARADKILDRIGSVDALPALPGPVAEGMRLIDSPDVDVAELTAVLAQDVALASQILRVANSAAYANSGGNVDNIQHGIMRLGIREVRNLLVTFGVKGAFQISGVDFDADAFWKHSMTAAMAAGALAKASSTIDTSVDAGPYGGRHYLAGLAHDIGVLACVSQMKDGYLRILSANEAANEPLFVTEVRELGFHHGEVGAALALRWNLPEEVVIAAEFHHTPWEAPDEYRRVAELVHLADWMTGHFGYGYCIDGRVERFEDLAWHELGLDISEFSEIVDAMEVAATNGSILLSATA